MARSNQSKLLEGKLRRRERTAELVMRLLGDSKQPEGGSFQESLLPSADESMFADEEKEMISRVLQLSSLPVRAVMTVRRDVEMLDLSEPEEQILRHLAETPHSRLVAIREGNKDQPLGIIRKRDVLARLLSKQELRLDQLVQQPLCLPETINVLNALEQFRQAKNYLAFVLDEFGNFEGIASIRDIMEEIAGKLPETGEEDNDFVVLGPDSYHVSGDCLLQDLQRHIGFPAPATAPPITIPWRDG